MTSSTVISAAQRGRFRLIAAALVMILLWGGLLPWLGQTKAVKRWIEPLREQGINPSALYYTDVFEDRSKR